MSEEEEEAWTLDQIHDFLQDLGISKSKLTRYAQVLRTLGVEKESDLKYLKEEHLTKNNWTVVDAMKLLQGN